MRTNPDRTSLPVAPDNSPGNHCAGPPPSGLDSPTWMQSSVMESESEPSPVCVHASWAQAGGRFWAEGRQQAMLFHGVLCCPFPSRVRILPTPLPPSWGVARTPTWQLPVQLDGIAAAAAAQVDKKPVVQLRPHMRTLLSFADCSHHGQRAAQSWRQHQAARREQRAASPPSHASPPGRTSQRVSWFTVGPGTMPADSMLATSVRPCCSTTRSWPRG